MVNIPSWMKVIVDILFLKESWFDLAHAARVNTNGINHILLKENSHKRHNIGDILRGKFLMKDICLPLWRAFIDILLHSLSSTMGLYEERSVLSFIYYSLRICGKGWSSFNTVWAFQLGLVPQSRVSPSIEINFFSLEVSTLLRESH